MNNFYWFVGTTFLLCLLVGLVRVVIGPGTTDRMLSVQLFGTTGVGFLLMLFMIKKDSAILDMALVMALLGSFIFITYAVFRTPGGQANGPDSE